MLSFMIQINLTLSDGQIIYELLNKWDGFPFYIAGIPHFQNKIPHTVFNGKVFPETLHNLSFLTFTVRQSWLVACKAKVRSKEISKTFLQDYEQHLSLFKK